MFQFAGFPSAHYYAVTGIVHVRMHEGSSCGFPHSDTHGSTGICPSPWLFAACRVFLRLLVPRHPPCALYSLTCLRLLHRRLHSVAASRQSGSSFRALRASGFFVLCFLLCCFYHKMINSSGFPLTGSAGLGCLYLVVSSYLIDLIRVFLIPVFGFQGTIGEFSPAGLSGHCLQHFRAFPSSINPVGLSGLEPPTSRLSGVRSNRLSYKPKALHGLCSFFCSGSHLLSHAVPGIVPSAARVLTVVFGMDTGVSPGRIATRFLHDVKAFAALPSDTAFSLNTKTAAQPLLLLP